MSSKRNVKRTWLVAGLALAVACEAAAKTPVGARLSATGRAGIHRYWQAGRRYATHFRWSGWRHSRKRVASRRISYRRRVATHPVVPSVGRAATIIEPPLVRVAVKTSPAFTSLAGARSYVTAARVAPFRVSGPPISGTILDGLDAGGRVSLVTDEGRFITVRLNEATGVTQNRATLGAAQVNEGMRVVCRGSWQPGGNDSYEAATIAVRGKVDDRELRAKIAEACRKLKRTQTTETGPTPSPVSEAPSNGPVPSPGAGENTSPAPTVAPAMTVPAQAPAQNNVPSPGPVLPSTIGL